VKRLWFQCVGLLIAAFAISSSSMATALTPIASVIQANDNRLAAGQLVGHELHLSLDAVWGQWYPDGPGGKAVPIQAFAQVGQKPQIPGPLIRVPLGTVAIIKLHNAIPGSRLIVHGLLDRPAPRDQAFDIPFGQTRVVRLHANALGTYLYWATTTGASVDQRFGADSQLGGALVIDPRTSTQRTPRDRIFVISEWDNVTKKGNPNFDYLLAVINGRSWPYTERLSYAKDTTIHWRLVNASFESHPLHLHGFYFRVDSRGDGVVDVIYQRDSDRDRRVTELIEPGHTFSMTWHDARVGNWLFHCHLTYHTMGHMPIADMLSRKTPLISNASYENEFLRHAGMGGLILGVSVHSAAAHFATQPPASRHIGLLVQPAPDNQPDAPSFKYVLNEEGTTVTEPGAIGPPIVLTRGIPVAIDVTNGLAEPTAVHWHGMELQDSFYDGVAGWSGRDSHLTREISPGETFEVHIDPPRAGTFIYHTHMADVYQLRGGLAGPLIVIEPGQRFDTTSDHIFAITTTHRIADALKIFVNGAFQPAPLVVRAGTLQRLRFINMTTFWTNVIVSLSAQDHVLQWLPVARDGADLPIERRTPQFAVETITIGDTADFMFTPKPGDSLLQIWPATGLTPVNIAVHAN
jgi:FtsP/CotA-like multicopper oxidase with cupredoxin domain